MEDVWLNKNVTQQQNAEITSTNNVPFFYKNGECLCACCCTMF